MTVERTLHHFPLDPSSRQVRLVLGEKRLQYTDVVVRYWEQPSDLLALNPSGMTPVLVEVEDGKRTVLCESRAILGHLEDQHPEPPLMGREPGERAEARRLLQWFDRKFDFEVGAYLLHEKMEKRLLGLGAPDLANLRHGREALKAHLLYLDRLLQDRDWMAGRRLSLADFAAASYLSVIDYFGDVPWRDFAAVKMWYMKLKSRPCFRPLLLDRWSGVGPPAGNYDDLDF